MSTQPNIVLIMTDQQRADLLAREGYPLDTMPFCDRLARQGQWFDRAYTSCPACVPARVATFTGRFGSANRIRCNQNDLRADVRAPSDLVNLLRAAGYATALCGKNHSHLSGTHFDHSREYWHCHCPHSATAEEQAFDRWMQATEHHLALEPTPFPIELQYPYRIVSDAIAWVDQTQQRDEQPFFLWLSFPEPHNPYQVPRPYWDLFPPESLPPLRSSEADLRRKSHQWQWGLDRFREAFPDYDATRERARSNYLGLLRLIDDQVRRFVEHLDAAGLRDDTLLVVTSDHGDFVGEYGLLRKGPGLPELLTRIPFSVTGPGIPAGGDAANPAHISLVDLLPTCCGLAGATVPVGVQGRDLTGLWRGDEDPLDYRSMLVEQGFGGGAYDGGEAYDPTTDGHRPSPDGSAWGAYDELNSVTQSGLRRSVRMGDWKLIAGNDGARELYHLADDPLELHDRWHDPACAGVRAELQDELIAWLLAVADDLPIPAKRYTLKAGRSSPHGPTRENSHA